MTVEYIRYKIDAARQEKFIDDYRQAAESLDQSSYCLGYELSHCEEETERFILRIQWTSTADHLEKFRPSKELQSFLPHIRPYIDDIEEMQHYQPTAVVSDKG